MKQKVLIHCQLAGLLKHIPQSVTAMGPSSSEDTWRAPETKEQVSLLFRFLFSAGPIQGEPLLASEPWGLSLRLLGNAWEPSSGHLMMDRLSLGPNFPRVGICLSLHINCEQLAPWGKGAWARG